MFVVRAGGVSAVGEEIVVVFHFLGDAAGEIAFALLGDEVGEVAALVLEVITHLLRLIFTRFVLKDRR